jgi:hypothetical protein
MLADISMGAGTVNSLVTSGAFVVGSNWVYFNPVLSRRVPGHPGPSVGRGAPASSNIPGIAWEVAIDACFPAVGHEPSRADQDTSQRTDHAVNQALKSGTSICQRTVSGSHQPGENPALITSGLAHVRT